MTRRTQWKMTFILIAYIIFVVVLAGTWLKDKTDNSAQAFRPIDTFQVAHKPIERRLARAMEDIPKVGNNKINDMGDIQLQLAFMNSWEQLAHVAAIDHRPEIVRGLRAFKAKAGEAQKTFLPKMRAAYAKMCSYEDATGQCIYQCDGPGATVMNVNWKGLTDEDYINQLYSNMNDMLPKLRFKELNFRLKAGGPVLKKIALSSPADEEIESGGRSTKK